LANPEHVALVRRGAEAIREWRRNNPNRILDLSRADLALCNLSGVDLGRADLDHADLSGAHLREANLSGARFLNTDLYEADLTRANLRGALLTKTELTMASLVEADLVGAELNYVDLIMTNLARANLKEASLSNSHIKRSFLLGTDLTRASLSWTSIADCNLVGVKGLETVQHGSPSSISFDTLILSFRGAGNILTPNLRTFFRGAGVPEELLKEIPRIISEIKYYNAFIAYGEPDAKFARRLKNDLEGRGVQCRLYSTDHTVGERTWQEITEKRRGAEKMVVLCSVRALIRDGLLKEIEEQMDEDPDKMIPVSLDTLWQEKGFLVQRAGRDLKPFLLDKNYANFHSESVYEESLELL